jgi:hypothetical protein
VIACGRGLEIFAGRKHWVFRALILTLLVGCAAADVVGQAAVGSLLAADYLQTRQIVRDGYENNPLIGSHGQRIPPARYFLAAFALHTAVAVLLPRPWRNVWQGAICVSQGVTVWNNAAEGYAIEF